MVVNEIPLMMKKFDHCLEEEESILFGYFDQELGNSGTKVMLVDHFIEVPESMEKRFDDVI